MTQTQRNPMQIPAKLTTRLSKDVWELAQQHALEHGLSSPRQAIEQIVRLSAKEGGERPAPPQNTAVENGAQALDALQQIK